MLPEITKRASKLDAHINTTGVKDEQAHLNKDSRESLYWHYGYLIALKDVLAQLNQPIITDYKLDRYN